MKTTVTRQGETWDMISYRMYGDEHYIRDLMDANPGMRRIVRFSAGASVAVPEVTVKTAASLPPWKRS